MMIIRRPKEYYRFRFSRGPVFWQEKIIYEKSMIIDFNEIYNRDSFAIDCGMPIGTG